VRSWQVAPEIGRRSQEEEGTQIGKRRKYVNEPEIKKLISGMMNNNSDYLNKIDWCKISDNLNEIIEDLGPGSKEIGYIIEIIRNFYEFIFNKEYDIITPKGKKIFSLDEISIGKRGDKYQHQPDIICRKDEEYILESCKNGAKTWNEFEGAKLGEYSRNYLPEDSDIKYVVSGLSIKDNSIKDNRIYKSIGKQGLYFQWNQIVQCIRSKKWKNIFSSEKSEMVPRDILQAMLIDEIIDVLNINSEVYMHILQRTGKSYIIAMVAMMKKLDKIVIITHYPTDTFDQFLNIFGNYSNFNDYKIICSYDKNFNKIDLSKLEKYVCIVSAQKIKQMYSKDNGNGLSKFFGNDIDLIAYDEVQYGINTDTMKKIVKLIKSKYTAYMSGTMEELKSIVGFIDSRSLVEWTLMDLSLAKQGRNQRINYALDKYPTYNRNIFKNKKIFPDCEYNYCGFNYQRRKILEKYNNSEIEPTMDKIYSSPNNLKSYLSQFLIDNKNQIPGDFDEPLIMFVCPSIEKSKLLRDALEDLQKDQKAIDMRLPWVEYNIEILNSSEEEKFNSKIQKIENSNKKTIIIVVGQGIVGRTYKGLHSIVIIHDIESYTKYSQLIARCWSEYSEDITRRVFDLGLNESFIFHMKNLSDGNKNNYSDEEKRSMYRNDISVLIHGKKLNYEDIASEISKISNKGINYLINSIVKNIKITENMYINTKLKFNSEEKISKHPEGGTRGKTHTEDTEDTEQNESSTDNDQKRLEKIEEETKKFLLITMMVYIFLQYGINKKYNKTLKECIDLISIELQNDFNKYITSFGLQDFDWEKIKNIIWNQILLDSRVLKDSEILFERMKFSLNNMVSEEEFIPMKELLPINELAKRTKAEVFTPKPLVIDMLNKFQIEVWKNINYKWIDNACGSGIFLIVIAMRLLNGFNHPEYGFIPGLTEIIPDVEERKKKIASMLYGIDIQSSNVWLTRIFLEKILGNIEVVKQQVICEDSLKFDYWNGTKFDVVVGNPPYNDIKNKSNNTISIYPDFVDKGVEITKKYVLMITPSRWFFSSSCSKHRKNMIYKYGLKYLNHSDDNKLFSGTDIKGGISYFICENGYNGKCLLDYKNNKEYRDFKINGNILLEKNNEDIINKITQKIKKDRLKITSSIYNRNGHINTNDNRMKIENGDIKCYASKKRIMYVSKNDINLESVNYGKFKAITPLAQGTGYDIISDFIFCDKNDIANSSYIVFPFNTEKETKNFIHYTSLKLIKYLISLRKSTQAITSTCFDYVPIIWNEAEYFNNQDVYNYFGISKEEINIIERIVN